MNMPIIDITVKHLEEQICAALMVRQEEISAHVKRGVESALSDMGETIKNQAKVLTEKAVRDSIFNYFSYGEGSKLISAAVNKTMSNIINANKEVKKKG